ncbi:MAG: arylesterase [Burkholderiaceae bacterium]|nr:arylesterase [Burkholderiaceae bacterium]
MKLESRLAQGARRRWVVAAVRHCSALALAGPVLLATAAPAQGTPAAATATQPVILIVGDSLSAEYGLAREKLPWRVVNASISGDTTSGGRTRLPALLREHSPRVVVIELGGNDALRGLPLAMTQGNLTAMTQAAKAAGARVLIAGMQVPPNYGRAYGEAFANLFATVARAEGAALVPFFLAGVADVPDADRFFQPDRIHPTAEAQPRMLDNVWPALRPLLRAPG